MRNKIKEIIRPIVQELMSEALRGGRQTLMMKGMTGDRMGILNLDDPEADELEEYHITNASLSMIKKDLTKFINTEHEKLGNSDKRDSIEMIRQIIQKLTTRDL